MTPEMLDVFARVQSELGEMIEAFDREAPRYARELTEWVLSGAPTRQPPSPVGLHSFMAKAIRETVLDEAAMRHRLPVRCR